ncbi:MAG TPA: His/Gly/Thr/Pro-type tRNA ligase C-terminal domain-containing protein, partial [Longimicrobiales bacterium]|nr:His/Gly/Thr/Pro-type tRNA ligase C-terminal domain-containing protein [Longimicrobiales bacterium]
EYAWNTSWGSTTRLIGALVMTHGDDNGLVLPPKVAPVQVVIVPIYRKDEERALVLDKANEVAKTLRGRGVRVHIDARDNLKPGPKYYEWERKGVPMRMEIGPRDVAAQKLVLVMRREFEDMPRKEILDEADAIQSIPERLDRFQAALLAAATRRREANSHRGVTEYARLREIMEGDGGFVFAGWCGSADCETKVREELKATIRVVPFEEFRSADAPATCLVCGAAAQSEAVWARAY